MLRWLNAARPVVRPLREPAANDTCEFSSNPEELNRWRSIFRNRMRRHCIRSAGVTLGTAMAGVRKANRRDVTVVLLEPRARGRRRLHRATASAPRRCSSAASTWPPAPRCARILVNTGNANAGTGEDGLARARSTCAALAARLGCAPEPGAAVFHRRDHGDAAERSHRGRPAGGARRRAAPTTGATAAEAIMTTDTVPKAASRQAADRRHGPSAVTGISKGAGMIRPNMATMLGFVATDAAIAPALVQQLVREAADESFNRITIDGDTSTNDSFVLIATQRAGNAPITQPRQRRRPRPARRGVRRLAAASPRRSCATARARPSSSPCRVDGGASVDECRKVAYAIAPLAAGQDGVLRQRSEPRPHPRRGRLRRHRRPRPDPDRPLPRRRRTSSKAAAAARRTARRTASG